VVMGGRKGDQDDVFVDIVSDLDVRGTTEDIKPPRKPKKFLISNRIRDLLHKNLTCSQKKMRRSILAYTVINSFHAKHKTIF
jgi:hypothetical protein